MDTLSKFPLYLPGRQSETNNRLSFISSDIRQEKTLLAHCTTDNGQVILEQEKYYPTKSYDSFSEIVLQFMKDTGISEFSRIAVGTPGPVINGQCVSIRLPWMLDAEKIKTETGINLVYLINDVEATAYGLADLCNESLTTVYESETPTTGNVAILAPGEGLGEAGLYYDGTHLRPFATEGGHSEFSPRTNIEVEFYQFLNQIYGIVSWENVLSKKGLFNIFRFLRDEKRHPLSEKLLAKLQVEEDFCVAIYRSVIEDQEQISTITVNTYLEFLAREANSLVLKLKATGGLLIGGELPFLFRDYIDKNRLYQKFMISDKMERLLKNIPIFMIPNDKMVLVGAAYYTAFAEI